MTRQPSVQVSVIIPFFNTPGSFLHEAVTSVLEQASVTLELLLVDDGSDPEAARKAREVAAAGGRRVRYLTHPDGGNHGTSATRNLGVSEARGEFVAFLDSDDVWLPDKLAEQVEVLRSTPAAAMVFGLSEYWNDWSGAPRLATSYVPDAGARQRRLLEPPVFVSDFLRGRIVVPNPSNFMVRRSAYLACGGFEESFPGMYDDQVFLAKLCLEHPVCVVPRCWDRYRQHQDSLSARDREMATEESSRRRFLLWLRDYCRERGLYGPDVGEAIAKELWLCRPAEMAPPGFLGRRIRWLKKWLLRIEEGVVPAGLRHIIWNRDSDL